MFRLCRIIYTSHRWLQRSLTYIVLLPAQSSVICLLLLPVVLATQSIEYMNDVYFCTIPFKNTSSMLWAVTVVYGIPLITLTSIHLRILSFIHRRPKSQLLTIQRRHQRDLHIVRRIFFTVAMMMSLGTPTIGLFIFSIIKGREHPLTQHIQWLTIGLLMTGLHLFTILLTPQVQRIIISHSWRKKLDVFTKKRKFRM